MDDDDDDQPLAQQSRRESKKDGSATNVAMGPIYLMWENALEKLKILNYEESFCALQSRKPFNRVYFAMPSTNASHQFDDFIEICAWLCGEITHNQEFFQKDQFDDPNTVANKLMLALRQLEFRLSFPSQKLKTAHGEHVCSVLEFLTDSALQAKGFKWGTPVYMEADEVERADVDDDERDDDEIADEAGHGMEEDVLFEETDRVDAVEASLDASAHHILQPAIDPIEWKTELERVGPKLKAQQPLSTNEWRAHVDQTSVSKNAIEKVLGDAQTDLSSLNRGVSDDLSRMRMKEKYMNNQFTATCAEYKEIKSKLEELESKSGKTNEHVAKLTNELSEVSEKLEDLKDTFESKDSGIHDTSPLVRIKAALQQVKAEVMTFDLRIGVVSQSLLAARIQVANRRRVSAAQKAKQRRVKGARGIRGKEIPDDDSLSGDD